MDAIQRHTWRQELRWIAGDNPERERRLDAIDQELDAPTTAADLHNAREAQRLVNDLHRALLDAAYARETAAP